jgi:PAS domain S-box-containing protein
LTFQNLMQKLLRLLDVVGPPPKDDSVEARRSMRSIVAATLLGIAILSTTALSTAFLPTRSPVALLNGVWSIGLVALLLLCRHFRATSLLPTALVTLAFTHTLIVSSIFGGRNVGALFAFCVFPLVAVLLAGWRSGLVFTALSSAAVVLTPLLPPLLLFDSSVPPAPIAPELVRDALNVVIAVGLLSTLYDAVRGSTLRDAETSRARAQRAADRQEQLLDLSRRLHDATGAGFEMELQRAMEQAAKLAGADRTVLRLLDGDRYQGRFSYGEEPETSVLEMADVDSGSNAFPWTAQRIRRGQTAQLRSLDELPPEAAPEREFFRSRGVRSWLCIPVKAGATSVGYQSFETTREERHWDEEEIAALGLMTELLAAAVLRHRTEIALRESENKFASAFHDHPDRMVISDFETDEILECNEEWMRMVQRSSREEVVGKRIWDFGFDFPEAYRERIREAIRDGGRVPGMEVPITGVRGDSRIVFVSSTAIEVAGRPCVLSSVQDLTERKQLEHQLLHAQKMEAVGRLAGGVAHDYNNMLTVISGYSAGLMAELDGPLREDAEEIHEAARRSAELTRQLLTFSRRQVLETEQLDPNDLIAGLESMLRPLVGESMKLRLDFGANVPAVETDRGQLEQAIVNLVVNARDAMDPGGTVSIETARVQVSASEGRALATPLPPGTYLCVDVCDEGSGISPDVAEHVLEPFFTTKPEGKGTGLGLPMVDGLAQQCGGALVLENRSAGGTRARIYLPACEEAQAATGSPAPRATAPAPMARFRVLLVEDEERVRRLAARILRQSGYEVFAVENGARAWERAQASGDDIDLVISDVVMPEMSGGELAHRLREQHRELPIVLMSGYVEVEGDHPIPDDAIFLSKPFEPKTLRETVERALQGKTPSRREEPDTP